MMEDMNMMLNTVPTSPNSFVVSPTISPREPPLRQKHSILLAAKARRNSYQQNFKGFATIGNENNTVARKIDHNLTVKLRSNKRVPSIGAAGGFRQKRTDENARADRERMFDSFENMN